MRAWVAGCRDLILGPICQEGEAAKQQLVSRCPSDSCLIGLFTDAGLRLTLSELALLGPPRLHGFHRKHAACETRLV